MALVETLIREMAIGLNFPYGFIYDLSAFGGVTARLETQLVERALNRYRRMLVDTLLEPV